MATVVRTYEHRFKDRFYFPAVVRGLFVTLTRIFVRKDTVQYPEKKHVPAEGYRGLHRLNKHPDRRIKCVACEMCATTCPSSLWLREFLLSLASKATPPMPVTPSVHLGF